MRNFFSALLGVIMIVGVVLYFEWGDTATLSAEDGYGAAPVLPEPNATLVQPSILPLQSRGQKA